MDYKYIEQLLERYWQCETTVAEERILREFFSQDDVPAALSAYRDLFRYEADEQQTALGSDFDRRVLEQIEEPVVRLQRNTWQRRLMPFVRAAAVVAVVAGVGFAAQRAFTVSEDQNVVSYNYDAYKDTYTDPQVAYEQMSDALKLVSDGLRQAGITPQDSLQNLQTEKL